MSVGFIRPELAHLAVPITQVTAYPGNPRRGDHARITASLTHHGQYTPLLVQKSTGYVVKGNNTLAVMHQLGWTETAVVRLDLDDNRARHLLMMDNRTSDEADYDLTALVDALGEVMDWEAAGWSPEDLDDLIASIDTGTTGLDTDLSALDTLATVPDIRDLPHPAAAVPPVPPVPSAPVVPLVTPSPVPPRAPAEPASDPAPARSGPPASPAAPAPPPPRPLMVELLVYLSPDDRAEAMRLLDAARDWIGRDLTNGEVVLRALRALAVLGDVRHDPGRTIRVGTLLNTAGYDIFTRP